MEIEYLDMKNFLDRKVAEYNNPNFIDSDPISIPHQFTRKEDIEISGFLAATIGWGNRKSIIKNANRMVELMGSSPFDFVMGHTDQQLEPLESFVHRTFNGTDFLGFVNGLKHIYTSYDGLEGVFTKYQQPGTLQPAIAEFKNLFFEAEHLPRTPETH